MDVESILQRLSSVDEDDDILLQLVMAGPKAAADLLLPYLGHSDSTWRAMAAKALGWVGRNEAATASACLEYNEGDRFPNRQQVLAAVEEVAETDDVVVVLHATEAMLNLGSSRDRVASRLAWLLSAANVETRRKALDLLAGMREDAQAALPVLLKGIVPAEQLEEIDAVERNLCWRSAAVIGEIGRASASAVVILQTWLASSDPMLRAIGASVLAEVSPNDAEMILPVLIEALESGDEEQRLYGAIGCKHLGPRAASALPCLVRIIEDGMEKPQRHSRSMAIEALGEIGSSECVPVLAKVIRELEFRPDDDSLWMDSANACTIMSQLGPMAKAAVPVLRRWVRRPVYNEMRLHAAVALWSINGDSEEALATARAWIKDEDKWLRCWGAELLGHLGSTGRPMEADLQALAQEADMHVQSQAAEALAKIRA